MTAAEQPVPITDADTMSHPEAAVVVELDVRDDLRSGREPFSRIMAAVSALRDGEVLCLRAIFEPVPLFRALAKRGFVHESKGHAPDDWTVWFWRPQSVPPVAAVAVESAPSTDMPEDDEHTTYLDVRGFGPPEPMIRTLVALESLPRDRVLVQINNRVPQFLLPVLQERGFEWEIDESNPDRVLVRICHSR